MSRAGELR
jgi:uncharacterized C2H2 Zn-finger protein